MKLKSETEQLREIRNKLNRLIDWQDIKANQAKRRYEIKKYWVFSFWLLLDAEEYRMMWETERDIKISLSEYLDVVNDMICNS